MKIFLSYRFSGEKPEVLAENIGKIVFALRAAGHEVWNSLDSETHYQQANYDNGQIMRHAMENLEQSEAILAFINSKEQSEGMLVEVGYALGKGKKFILAIQKDLPTTSLRFLADLVIEFSDLGGLCAQLSGDFSGNLQKMKGQQ